MGMGDEALLPGRQRDAPERAVNDPQCLRHWILSHALRRFLPYPLAGAESARAIGGVNSLPLAPSIGAWRLRLRRASTAALLALALALPSPHVAGQALPAPSVRAEPRIPEKAMAHIMARHGPESDAPGAGKYVKGTTEATIHALIAEALRNGAPVSDSHFRPATLYEYRFPQIIGRTIDGAPTNRIRVVVGRDGAVVTAYPR
jgi:hypothetical protein